MTVGATCELQVIQIHIVPLDVVFSFRIGEGEGGSQPSLQIKVEKVNF